MMANSSPPILAAEPRPCHRFHEPLGDLSENLISSGMPMNVVDGFESVEIDQTEREWLAGLRCGPDPVGEQALKAAPVGQPGQVVGQRYGHRRLPRLLGGALAFSDHEARPHDFGEHAEALVEHADDEAGDDGEERREHERQLGAAGQECDDERRGRGDDDNARLARDPVETYRANGGDDPDGDERQSEFDHAVTPGRNRRCQGERKRQRRPENASRAHLAPDKLERLKLHVGARLEPRNESKEGHGDERCRQGVKEGAGWRRRAEKRQSRNNDDPMDVGAKPRQRAILLAQERLIEGRHGGARRCAASGGSVERHTPLSHSSGLRRRRRFRRKLIWPEKA